MPEEAISLSTQVISDCSGSYGNNGCLGGQPFNALAYVYDNGVPTESCSPYLARNLVEKDDKCSNLEICK